MDPLYGAYSNLGEEEYSCLRPGEHFFNINYDKELNRISFKKMQFAVLYIYIYRRYMQHVLRHFYAAQYVLRAARAARSTLCAARSNCCVRFQGCLFDAARGSNRFNHAVLIYLIMLFHEQRDYNVGIIR